jgi:hypothetical protein
VLPGHGRTQVACLRYILLDMTPLGYDTAGNRAIVTKVAP